MKIPSFMYRSFAAVLSLCSLMACRGECVQILQPTELLDRPGILSGTYSDSTYRPPHVMSVLQPGNELRVHGKTYEKDFLAYKVRTQNGLEGYIVYDSRVKHIEQCTIEQ
jgi:hypothetical protein